MNTRWTILVLAMLFLGSLSAFAGPQIGVLDPLCNTSNGPNGIGSYDFGVTTTNADGTVSLPSFSPNANGGGSVTYCNLTQTYWSEVFFNASGSGFLGQGQQAYSWNNDLAADSTEINCNVGAGADQTFLHCQVDVTDTSITMHFWGVDSPNNGNNNLGIRNNHTMTVTLDTGYCVPSATDNCNNNTGEWTGNFNDITISGSANGITTPEPASLALLGTGMASLFLLRRKRR